MKEYLTPGNIALAISVITALYTVFKAIAEKTENKPVAKKSTAKKKETTKK